MEADDQARIGKVGAHDRILDAVVRKWMTGPALPEFMKKRRVRDWNQMSKIRVWKLVETDQDWVADASGIVQ